MKVLQLGRCNGSITHLISSWYQKHRWDNNNTKELKAKKICTSMYIVVTLSVPNQTWAQRPSPVQFYFLPPKCGVLKTSFRLTSSSSSSFICLTKKKEIIQFTIMARRPQETTTLIREATSAVINKWKIRCCVSATWSIHDFIDKNCNILTRWRSWYWERVPDFGTLVKDCKIAYLFQSMNIPPSSGHSNLA